jgi:hypothetical protein
MQLVIQNQCKGPGNDCVALTTKLEVFLTFILFSNYQSSTYLDDYSILIISIGSKDTFLDAWVKVISFKDHVHVILIDCNTD